MDIFGNQATFGKVIGSDIMERKLGNIVILKALKEFSFTDKKSFLRILKKDEISKKDVKKGIAMINRTDSKKSANLLAKSFLDKAKKELKGLPDNKWRGLLFEIGDFAMGRGK